MLDPLKLRVLIDRERAKARAAGQRPSLARIARQCSTPWCRLTSQKLSLYLCEDSPVNPPLSTVECLARGLGVRIEDIVTWGPPIDRIPHERR
jgi:hypothetical protein